MGEFRNKILNFAEYYLQPRIHGYIRREKAKRYERIGEKTLGKSAPRALLIYVTSAIPYYISGNVMACPFIDSHAMIWEAAEMVRLLNHSGYVVDVLDCFEKKHNIDWETYNVIIDERNNLIHAPQIQGQTKVYYSTGMQWEFHNAAEMLRTRFFHARHGIWLNPQRIVEPIMSDCVASHMTYFGNPENLNPFAAKPEKHPLNVSVTHVPEKIFFTKRPLDFLWMGSSGALHKGLDLAVDALADIKGSKLHIFGHLNADPLYRFWLKDMCNKHPNVVYHGPAKINSESFRQIASSCLAHVYPSCAEGGPGSVAQTGHFGLIPIVTQTANVRSAVHGIVLKGENDHSLISSIRQSAETLLSLGDNELKARREAIIDFSRANHTREAYSQSIKQVFNHILK
ncbi:MAG TPA: hypothetical protein PLQ93_05130 [Bacteroidia bacterium]|nr:hypothetical protein [Bacteroidia bacterium]